VPIAPSRNSVEKNEKRNTEINNWRDSCEKKNWRRNGARAIKKMQTARKVRPSKIFEKLTCNEAPQTIIESPITHCQLDVLKKPHSDAMMFIVDGR
jgi:hypothetical protein